jgi:hypothetical protein
MARSKNIVPPDSTSDNQPTRSDADETGAGQGGLDFNPADFENEKPAPQAASNPSADGRKEQPAAEAAPDPFDPATYKVAQNLAAAAGVKKHLTELAVCTPNKAWWVRRHPSPEYAIAKAWVIELKDQGETYLVSMPLWPRLMGEATFKPKALYLATTMQGKLFLWPVRVPADDTKEPDRWMRAPLQAVGLAKDRWTRITWNDETRQHDVVTCDSDTEPEWPDVPFRTLLEIAFKDFVIKDRDHPVLRRLRGETR